MSRILPSVLALLLLSVAAASAQTWRVDPDHSAVSFRIRHIVGTVPGTFRTVGGSFDIDPAAPEQGHIEFHVDVAGVDTGIDKRDAHLRTADFFDAERYPRITFVSDRITRSGPDAVNVHGTLTIKDVSRPVTIPMLLLGVVRHPLKKDMPCTEVLGARADFSLRRTDYHVGDGKFVRMGITGDEVDLIVDLELLHEIPGCE